MLKKLFAALGAAILSAAVLSSCDSQNTVNDEKISIVCTSFPCYDWTRQIVGDNENIEITYLLSSGADIHSFQPTAEDMIKIADCDVIVYIGGESDKWVEDAIGNKRHSKKQIVDLMDAIQENLAHEEIKEGMADEHDPDDAEYDEHIWLSLNNAEKCVASITTAVCNADPDNYAVYIDNASTYRSQLQLLDRSFHMLFDGKHETLIFGDRFPFLYLVRDYALDYYAAFTGCSADTQASFETITFLAQKADEIGADTIFAIENSDCTIADAVAANTKNGTPDIAILDSIQSVTSKQIEEGASYYSAMENNYNVLKEVFNRE